LDWWNSLSQELRNGIISTVGGGAVLAIAAAVVKLTGRSLTAMSRKLFRRGPNPIHAVRSEAQSEEPKPELPAAQLAEAADRASHNLPRPPQFGFVIRKDKDGHEIAARLKEELAPQKNQLVALWGDGGVGKTTIAAEVARALIDAFKIVVVWISAEGRLDFGLSALLDEIATQLGEAEIRKLATEPKKEAVGALIDDCNKSLLVVLDNFETITPVEQNLCAAWIAKDAHCPALITTRGLVNGARNVPVDVMSTSEAYEFINRVIEQTQKVRHFEGLDRARIIEAAEANPLVMQWVIAQIDLAQRPADVLDDLARGEGEAAQKIFDRSFNLAQLGDDGRDALLALSLFVPDASRVSLAEVAGFSKDERRLKEAVKSMAALCLVETTSAGERLVVKGLTRDLASARLSKDERAADFRRRFVAHFVEYAESHAETTKEDFDALEMEKDNVLGSMDVAFEMKDWSSVMRTASATNVPPTGFLYMHGYWSEATRCNKQALEAARLSQSESGTAAFAHNLAMMHGSRGDMDEALPLYNESLEIERKLGNQSGIASSLHQLAILAQDQGEIEEARRLYNESLNIKKKLGNQSGIASTLHQLGLLAQDQGEIEEARRLCIESLEIAKKLGHQSGIAITLHQLARLAQDQGEIEEARRLYNESLDIKKKLGNKSGIARSLHNLAALAQDQGEIEEARRLYNESLEIAKKLGDQSGIADTLGALGTLAEDEGSYAEAIQLFREALIIFERLKSPTAELARRSIERTQSEMK